MAQSATTVGLPGHITLAAAVEQLPIGFTTLRNGIRDGHIPAVKYRGKVHVRLQDVEGFLAPRPITAAGEDDRIRRWAKRVAANAPVLRPEQLDVVVAAFSEALQTKGV